MAKKGKIFKIPVLSYLNQKLVIWLKLHWSKNVTVNLFNLRYNNNAEFTFTLFFRSHLCKNTKLDLHNNLKETLTSAFLAGSMNGGENFRRWKNYLMRHCRFTRHEYTTIRRDFVYLEKNDLLAVGDYKFLIKMFEHIDKRAIPLIKKTALKINEAPIVRHKTGFVYNFKL